MSKLITFDDEMRAEADAKLAGCHLCGDDLGIHEWIRIDADGNIVGCDRQEPPEPQEPADPAYEAYCEAQLARGELAGVAETAECYECCGFDGIHFEIRKIVALGPVVEAHRDPTQSYKLECGHTTI
jgi:hypothetical protein